MLSPAAYKRLQESQDRLLDNFLNDEEFVRRLGRHPLHACLMKVVPKAKPGQKVLEVGCGPGKYVALLRTAGFDVVGIDPGFFDSWERLTAKGGITLMTDVAAEDLPFPDEHFDHVTCLGTLLYLKDPDKGLREMRRVIKPGGTFVCRTVNSLNFYTMVTGERLDPASNQLYTMAELKEAVKRAGFTVDGSFSFGFWPPIQKDYWWYLICVRIPVWVQGLISFLTPASRRVNNTVYGRAV
jgi:SAM-dependent methyltransferase